jgi:lipoprotein-anchoring transpeptidase ErfK/SrfK
MLRPASEEEHGLERSARLRRRRVIRSGGLGAVVAGAVLALVPSAAATVPASQTVPGVEIARIVVATPVRARPTSRSSLRSFLSAVRPLTSQQTAVPVVRSAVDSHDAAWLMVRLPGRPIGRVGWILASSAVVAPSPWRVVIDRKARRATLFRDGRIDSRFPVVVGAPWTPTPVGHYFVAEHVRQPIGSVLGPWALATSAY